MKLVTAEQMRALEQRADKSGNSFAAMMERAGKAVADTLIAHLGARGTRNNRVLVLVGPGNNGGDGLVCARALCDTGADISLYIWNRAGQHDDRNFDECMQRGLLVVRAEDDTGLARLRKLVTENDVIVDALLGTGVTRPIEGRLRELLGVVKEELERPATSTISELIPSAPVTRGPTPLVVAVDLPSGLNPDTGALDPSALTADLTVTFAFPKIGQLLYPGAGAVGELVVADIGIPAEWASDVQTEVASAADIAERLPSRPQNSHKGTFGKALICAGSGNYVGAAYLAGAAATRAGAGLVTLALAAGIQPIVAAASHETTYLPLPNADGALTEDALPVLAAGWTDYDALLIGPGFGRHPRTIELVRRVLRSPGRPGNTVIDADALYALSQSPGWWKDLMPGTTVLTPHPGEMATLCGVEIQSVQADRSAAARKFSAEWAQVIVLKGAHTLVAAPDGRLTIIPFATPALATAGTGDVLAGTIVALLAQKLGAFDAAVVGTYLHGLAGKLVEEEIGLAGGVAGDLLPRLPRAIRRVRGE